MGDWRDIHSINKTIESYMSAFAEMVKLCPKVEPGCNSYNQRIVLPTEWNPIFGANQDDLLPYATRISVNFEDLFDLFTPKAITSTTYYWKNRWFCFNWYIDFPFDIYDWDAARQELINPEDTDNPKYNTIPEHMKAWWKGQLTLSSRWSEHKGWAMKDWESQHQEILAYLDNCKHSEVITKYRESVSRADAMLAKWKTEINKITALSKSLGE